MNAKKRIIVGLSGGVDSAVAALLLQRQGWHVRGLFMKNWEEDDTPNHCSALADLTVATAVAEHLGIELLTVNFASEYWDRVFEHFLAVYKAGNTPNPDVLCNSEIKFKAFLDYALESGADAIATGHYARIVKTPQEAHLLLSADHYKDQTYFLHRLNQAQLIPSCFPVGDLTKTEVRTIAAQAGLPNAARKDSTGVCFIGERHFKEFLSHYLPPTPGPIETSDGVIIGQHQGLMYHTIGQRQGLGIGGVRGRTDAPWFVVGKDIAQNTLQVVQGKKHPLLWQSALQANDWNWISGKPPNTEFICHARIRHRQPLQECKVSYLEHDNYQVTFTHHQWAIAPGQAVVLYSGNECIGGGVIKRSV